MSRTVYENRLKIFGDNGELKKGMDCMLVVSTSGEECENLKAGVLELIADSSDKIIELWADDVLAEIQNNVSMFDDTEKKGAWFG